MGKVIYVKFRPSKCSCGETQNMFDKTTCMPCAENIATDLAALQLNDCPLVLDRIKTKALREE